MVFAMTKPFDRLIVAIVVSTGCAGVLAATVSAQAARQPAKQSSTTPLKTRTDAEITRLIKQALQREKSLSAGARKVQVVTLAGYVTLKGHVRSGQERAVVEAKAAQIAGDDYVMSQLTVPKAAGQTRAPAAR
jgi:osmotically-inducible protein OsmY